MKRRVLTATLAILLAVLGTAGVLAYVHKADSRALQGMRAVSVLVAQGPIQAGISANSAQQQGLLRAETLPASSVPPNALRSITGLGSLVMSAQVPSGQVLLRPMLVTAVQATGGVALPAGMIEVTVALCVPEAVAENIGPGSFVEVFDTYSPGPKGQLTAGYNCVGPHQQQEYGHAHTVVALPRVEVLSLGIAGSANNGTSSASTSVFNRSATDPSASSTPGVNSVLVTMAVTQAEAQRLILTTVTGLPYLALLQH